MAAISWKSFRFWESSAVRLAENDAQLLTPATVSAIAVGTDNVLIGSSDGNLRLLNQSFGVVSAFPAHAAGNITNIATIPDSSRFVTLAEDLSHEPELKFWDLDQIDKKTGHPKCLCSTTVQNGKKQFPVSALAVLQDSTQVAVGFANGSVTVIRGDFIHDRGTKQRTVLDSDQPITGLEFRQGVSTTLYISSTGRVSTLVVAGKGQGQPARTIFQNGCAVGCMTRDDQTGDVIIARDDAIYTFSQRGLPTSYPYHGEKSRIITFKDYAMLVLPAQNNDKATTLQTSYLTHDPAELFGTTSLVILSPELKLVVHSEALSSQVNNVFCAWDSIFLLTQDGKLLRYREKTFEHRLDLLLQRDEFVLAINMAQKEHIDLSRQNTIFRRYGDYLYKRGDYDTAMQQYLRAIDSTEPSQIIRKYLDNQRLHNLIEYLEELHSTDRASSDHTTLLLNCFAKLKDVNKLEEFVKAPGNLKFDLDTAITMCRQGGFFDQAAYLARKHDEHALVIEILVEDLQKYAEALAYIWRLPPSLAYGNATRFGAVLLLHEPEDTTSFFIDYCTGRFRPKEDAVVSQQTPIAEGQGIATRATSAVQNLAAMIPLPYMSTTTTPLEDRTMIQQVVETTTDLPLIEYDVPEPRQSFPAFADHPLQFIAFLQACSSSQSISEAHKADVLTTLFEIYLRMAESTTGDEKASYETSARDLIQKHNVLMGSTNVLLLSHLSNYADGTTMVREQRGLYSEIFRAYTSAKDTQGAIQALRKYGPEQSELYTAALVYFTSSVKTMQEAGPELDNVLKKISQDNLMTPLHLIQTLSQTEVATMGLVKTYLSKTIEKTRSEIKSSQSLTRSYRADTLTKSQELLELDTKPTSFSATRCSSCGASLDLPVVHFMCKHSFHERCVVSLSENGDDAQVEEECPKCAPQNDVTRAIKRAQDESASKHDLFLDALGKSGDKFGTISEWFGRGVMRSGLSVDAT